MHNNNKCWWKAMWMQQLPPDEQCWQFGIFSMNNYMVILTSTTDGSGCISPGGGCFYPETYTLSVTDAIDRHMENIADLVEAGDLLQPRLPLPGMKEPKTKKLSIFFVSQVMKKYHQQMRKCKQFKLQGWNLQGYSQRHWPSLRLLFPQVWGTFFFFAPHLYIACR